MVLYRATHTCSGSDQQCLANGGITNVQPVTIPGTSDPSFSGLVGSCPLVATHAKNEWDVMVHVLQIGQVVILEPMSSPPSVKNLQSMAKLATCFTSGTTSDVMTA